MDKILGEKRKKVHLLVRDTLAHITALLLIVLADKKVSLRLNAKYFFVLSLDFFIV